MKTKAVKFLLVITLAILALNLGGCSTNPAVVGHVISVTDRGFGIDVETTSSPNQTPKVRLGFFSSTVYTEPVLTNAVASVPNVANTFSLEQSVSPFDFGVNETLASGNYRTGNPLSQTNAVASEPGVPR